MSRVMRDRINDLRDAIQDWIELATDWDFIDDDQYVPGPTNKAYFTYSLPSGIQKVGEDYVTYSESQQAFVQTGQRAATVSIKARGLPYKKNTSQLLRATDMLAELEWTIDQPETQAIFRRHGITIVERTPILETSDVEDNVLMPRGAMDLRIVMAIAERTNVDFIKTVQLEGELDTKLDGSFSTAVGPFTIPEEE